MDTKTGEILQFKNNDALKEALRENSNLVPLDKTPDPECPSCKGKGSIPGKEEYEPCLCTKSVDPIKYINDVKEGKMPSKAPSMEEMIQHGIKTLFDNSKKCKDGSLNFKNDEERMNWAIKRFHHLTKKLSKNGTPIVCDVCKKSVCNKQTGSFRRTISNTYIHENCRV